jgi:hypothetical protein
VIFAFFVVVFRSSVSGHGFRSPAYSSSRYGLCALRYAVTRDRGPTTADRRMMTILYPPSSILECLTSALCSQPYARELRRENCFIKTSPGTIVASRAKQPGRKKRMQTVSSLIFFSKSRELFARGPGRAAKVFRCFQPFSRFATVSLVGQWKLCPIGKF